MNDRKLLNVVLDILLYLYISLAPVIVYFFRTNTNSILITMILFSLVISTIILYSKKWKLIFEDFRLSAIISVVLIISTSVINRDKQILFSNSFQFLSLIIILINCYVFYKQTTFLNNLIWTSFTLLGLLLLQNQLIQMISFLYLLGNLMFSIVNSDKLKDKNCTLFILFLLTLALFINLISYTDLHSLFKDKFSIWGFIYLSLTLVYSLISRKFIIKFKLKISIFQILSIILFTMFMFWIGYIDYLIFSLVLSFTLFITLGLSESANLEQNIVFIASAGGHLAQMMKLSTIFKNYNSVLVTEKNEISNNLDNSTFEIIFFEHGSRFFMKKYVGIFSRNLIRSLLLLFYYRPHVIVSTGTHTAVPIFYFGKLIFDSTLIYIESYAKQFSANLAGELTYPVSDIFIVQWETMMDVYPRAKYWGGIY